MEQIILCVCFRDFQATVGRKGPVARQGETGILGYQVKTGKKEAGDPLDPQDPQEQPERKEQLGKMVSKGFYFRKHCSLSNGGE